MAGLTFVLVLLFTVCSSIRIETKLGEIIGTERISRDGRTYFAFTRVPFAKPPVGKLRFQNPVRAEPWQGVLDATKESPKCLQIDVFQSILKNSTIGEEDCLYLSVYTPDVRPSEKLAVLIQVHGGGFRFGSGGPKDNPDYIMDGNVILVNVHYRLGLLGFLSTEDTVITGNFGLKDQSLAIQWVKENIEDFGGDSEKLTLFGESAGGACTHFHMMSPISKSLLSGAISQSGVVNPFWSLTAPGMALSLAKQVAEFVGCGEKIENELLHCLQELCPKRLTETELKISVSDFGVSVLFRPVREPNIEGAFMSFEPLTQETTLPWITGIVSSEGIFKKAALMGFEASVAEDVIEQIDEYIIYQMHLDKTNSQTKRIVEQVKMKYFPDPLTVETVMTGVSDLFGDLYFAYPMGDVIKRHKGPLYQYYYDFRAGGSFTDLFGDIGDLGVSHADDMITLFNLTEMFPKRNHEEEIVSRTMVRLWTNFAKYQKPTIDRDVVQWPKYDSAGQYLRISKDLSVGRLLRTDIIEWWLNLFEPQKIYLKTEL